MGMSEPVFLCQCAGATHIAVVDNAVHFFSCIEPSYRLTRVKIILLKNPCVSETDSSDITSPPVQYTDD